MKQLQMNEILAYRKSQNCSWKVEEGAASFRFRALVEHFDKSSRITSALYTALQQKVNIIIVEKRIEYTSTSTECLYSRVERCEFRKNVDGELKCNNQLILKVDADEKVIATKMMKEEFKKIITIQNTIKRIINFKTALLCSVVLEAGCAIKPQMLKAGTLPSAQA
ncbi:hypothetical protein ACTFIW_003050 [Dictyostelium discoideum]